MESRNVKTYRAGHEAFNQRDFVAMTSQYAESITWTDHSQGRTFTTPQEFRADFLAGWVTASSDIKVTGPRYINAGQTVVCTFTVVGTNDGPLGPFPATGKQFTLPLCEMWHFDSSGRVVGGDLYYDQVSLLMQLGLMPQPSAAYAGFTSRTETAPLWITEHDRYRRGRTAETTAQTPAKRPRKRCLLRGSAGTFRPWNLSWLTVPLTAGPSPVSISSAGQTSWPCTTRFRALPRSPGEASGVAQRFGSARGSSNTAKGQCILSASWSSPTRR